MISSLIGEYRTLIETLVKAYQAIGLTPEEGLQGQFREAAHALTEQIPEHEQEDLMISRLRLRRQEKTTSLSLVTPAYISKAAEYHDSFQAAVKEYDAAIQKSTPPAEVKKVLTDTFGQYQAAAAKIMADPATELDANAETMRTTSRANEEAIKSIIVHGATALALDIRKNEKDYMLRNDEKYAKATREAVTKLKEAFAKAGIKKEHVDDLNTQLDAYQKAFEAMVAENTVISAGKVKMQGVVDKMEPLIESLATEINTAGTQTITEIIAQSEYLAKIAIAASLITIILAFLVAFALVRSICGPIDRAVKSMIASAEQVSAASGQVSSSSQALAEGATEQAAALEETSASMEEMASMTRQNSDNAGQADSLMRESLTTIKEADNSMTQMLRLLAEKAVELDYCEHISHTEVGQILKKTN